MKLKSLIVLLLAGIWGVGSWWWYTCKIKVFCGTDTTAAQITTGAAATGAASLSGQDLATDKDTQQTGTEQADTIDTDGDGITDAEETALGLNPDKEDTDGDGIADSIEMARTPNDTDGDGIIDALDNDDDGDGILTADENPDPNGDGNVDDAVDGNGNQIADYLDIEADGSKAGNEQAVDEADRTVEQTTTDKAAEESASADTTKAAEEAAAKTADQAAAEQLKAEEEAAAEKAKAEEEAAAAEKAKEDEDKVTMETNEAAGDNGSGIDPAILHFPTGSANPELSDETKAYFEKVAQFLKDNDTANVTIVGHTDDQGDAGKNKTLGMKRAEMIRQMLVDMGAPTDKVAASSEGEDKPIADNKTAEGRKKNRRVEVTPAK